MKESEETVFVVDDDPMLRKVLEMMLQSAGYAVELFEGVPAFLKRLPFSGVSCVITDLEMPGMSGLELQEKLVRANTRMPLIFMTGYGDIPASVTAMKKGAVDFLLKPFKRKDLLAAVREALDKDRALREATRVNQSTRERLNGLTPREREVMTRVVAGQMNKLIGFELGISEATVKVHRGRVMKKMGVQSLAELIKAVEPVSGA